MLRFLTFVLLLVCVSLFHLISLITAWHYPGGDGPKMADLLQMRETHFLQDRITVLGPVAHRDVPSVRTYHFVPSSTFTLTCMQVLRQGSIFLNTSLTEAFGIAILEAACAGLHVVSTRVGGVPEILPEDMISFAAPTADGIFLTSFKIPGLSFDVDVFRAMSEAIALVAKGGHDPHHAHQRIRGFYDWTRVAERTEVVYNKVLATPPYPLWTRIQRCAFVFSLLCETYETSTYARTMGLGPFVGPIYTIILIVDCLFFAFLEWWMPRENIDVVDVKWDATRFEAVGFL